MKFWLSGYFLQAVKISVKNSKVARVYGCHMNVQLKDAGERYVKTWLLTTLDYDENGNPTELKTSTSTAFGIKWTLLLKDLALSTKSFAEAKTISAFRNR